MIYHSIKCFDISECKCDDEGSKDQKCDENGQCTCKDCIDGDKCTDCKVAYYKFPDCEGIVIKNNRKIGSWILTTFQ